jgi:hypothetical protein
LFIIFKVLIAPQLDLVAIEKPLKRFRKHDDRKHRAEAR